MDDGPCPQRRIPIEYVSETFLDSVAPVRLVELYVACVSQKRHVYDGWQAPENTHTTIDGIQCWGPTERQQAAWFVEMLQAISRFVLNGHWDEPIILAADGLAGIGRITELSDTGVWSWGNNCAVTAFLVYVAMLYR
jgi:hypothetical protein